MIQADQLTKRFDNITALNSLTTTIEEGSIYGLVGSNGAGKSTFLRLMAGIYRPSEGSLSINGQPIYENTAIKQDIFFIPDEIYQMPGASMDSLAKIYSTVYPNWSSRRYTEMVNRFPISPERRLAACSKGMRRQIALILALSCMPKYLLLDEAFDGLDPVVRVAVRKIIADDIMQYGTTVLIASHNLRELEDLCDQVGLLHDGKILFQRELSQLRGGFAKVQFAARPLPERSIFEALLDVVSLKSSGCVAEIIARGHPEQVRKTLQTLNPLLCESVPLTLEEIFITEMEAVGYDFNNVLF